MGIGWNALATSFEFDAEVLVIQLLLLCYDQFTIMWVQHLQFRQVGEWLLEVRVSHCRVFMRVGASCSVPEIAVEEVGISAHIAIYSM